jgi:DNA-binding MarR family transcriptional regulator
MKPAPPESGAPPESDSSPEERANRTSPYAESILRSLRRIIRAIDLHSRQLTRQTSLTVPQLVCLRQLVLNGPSTPGDIARKVFLSQATVTGILDRLEAHGLIRRKRSSPDRRRVIVRLTDAGHELAAKMPWPLQERFATALAAMPLEGQSTIDHVLRQIVDMMEAREIDAWPVVGAGSWNEAAEPLSSAGE